MLRRADSISSQPSKNLSIRAKSSTTSVRANKCLPFAQFADVGKGFINLSMLPFSIKLLAACSARRMSITIKIAASCCWCFLLSWYTHSAIRPATSVIAGFNKSNQFISLTWVIVFLFCGPSRVVCSANDVRACEDVPLLRLMVAEPALLTYQSIQRPALAASYSGVIAAAHPEWLGPCRGPHAGGGARELPTGRRQRHRVRGAATLPGRHCRAEALKTLLYLQASTHRRGGRVVECT